MAIRPWYATREQVQRALDVAETARADSQIDQALAAATESVIGVMHRPFYPVVDVRYFDWPARYSRPWRLWLGEDELVEVDSITNGADGALDAADYFLEPADGPPFTHVEIDLASGEGFSSGAGTSQRSIVITGTFGYSDVSAPAGALDGPLDGSATTVTVTDGAAVGVGDLLRVDDERLVVTGRSWVDSGDDLTGDLDASSAGTSVPVADGSAFTAGEAITVDSERMLIVDVVGNTLVVRRAYRGAVLAAHTTGADVYVDRSLTVVRGANGTTAAAHSDGAAVTRWVPPALIRSLTLAEAVATFEQEKAGYARTIGSGETEREVRDVGLAGLRDRARTAHGRQARLGAI